MSGSGIIQESLTNSSRHAPGAAAEIAIVYGADRLWLTIENATVNGHDTGRDGVGIAGRRERTAALGGSLDAGRGGGPLSRRRRVAVQRRSVIRVLIADDQAAVRGGFPH